MKPAEDELRLEIITLWGVVTAVAIAGFAIYRLRTGQFAAAAVDLGIIVLVTAPVLYAWKTGDSRRAGMILCVFTTLACVLACWVIGADALSWIYVVLLTNFFITGRRIALVLNLLMVCALLLIPGIFKGPFHSISVLVTAALTTLFCYIFATRSHRDRNQLRELASLDALSGVPNRRMMEKSLEQVVGTPTPGKRTYALIMLDLDRFKEVNDLYGHAAGDAAIADLATILRHEMRKDDQVFRFGGEEFAILLQVGNRDELEAATERLRKSVRDSLRGPGGRITISLGAAMLAQESDWHDWFSRADAALYRAKSNGRDSYVVADDLF